MKLFFFTLHFFILCFSHINAQITKSNTPTWIDNVTYSRSNIELSEVSSGIHVLLYDTQINTINQTVYNRLTTEIIDNVGIQTASSINVNYDPSYQKLKFHTLRVIRDKRIIDKLDVNGFQIMRRELNAENYLYDGTMTALMNISDVRTGDIIDYSYSIIGFNPIESNRFSDSFALNDFETIGKVNLRITTSRKLNYKSINASLDPHIIQNGNSYSYNWQKINTKSLDYELNTPAWKLIYDTVFISDYNTWQEVANWGTQIFTVKTPISSKLQAKITEIDNEHKSKGGKIKSTLDFVQNDIRYLGLESGIGSYKPFSPNKVFKQRFGDCKDKSLLMVTMLRKMGIDAYPMLVSTYLKHTIKELLPSPKLFDHCVVKVTDNNSSFYYDPTIPNQGGDYDSTHFPNYEYGLVLKKDNSNFDEIKPYSENKVKTLEEYSIDSIGKGALLKVTTTYFEGEADNMRNYYKNNSISAIKKEYENFYSNFYFDVKSVTNPKYQDDKYHNAFKIIEEYEIDSIWRPMPEKEGYIGTSFTPGSLLGALYMPTKNSRKSELAITYPVMREHEIKVKLPVKWKIEKNQLFINSPSFYYEWRVNYDTSENIIDLTYYLKTQKDNVAAKDFNQYLTDIKKLDLTTAYSIFIPSSYTSINNNPIGPDLLNNIISLVKVVIGIAVLVFFALLIYWISSKNKKGTK